MLAPTNAILLIVALFVTTEFAEAICENCLNSDECDNVSGQCLDFQCKYNWTNQPKCDIPCPPLTWGINCPYTCHCPVNDTCNIVNGACGTDKCAARWYGVACQKRMTELYDPPTVVNVSSSGSLLQWTRWSSSKDYGDGPAASYTIQLCKESLSESCWQAVANGTVMEPNSTSTNPLYAWVPGTANTTYWYRVVTNMKYLEVTIAGYPSRASLPVTLPSLPTNISSTDLPPVGPVAVSANATSAILVWQQPQLSSAVILPGGASLQVLWYNVTYAMIASLSIPGTCRYASNVSSGPRFSQLVPAAKTSLLITDLVPFTQYSLAVQALYTASYSSNSTSISFSTTSIAPKTAPDNITAGVKSPVLVSISWLQPLCSAVTGPIVRYDVSVFSNSSSVFAAAVSINDPSETVANVAGLRPSTNYSATVRLVNAVDVGPWSRPVLFRTPDDVPLPPENVIVSNVTTTRVIISWALANSTTTVKNVIISVHDKGPVGCTISDRVKYVQTVEARGARQLEVPNLSPWTRYSAELLCTNDVGNSTATAIVFFETAPSAPSASVMNVSITNVTARGMFVTWSPVSCESANGILLWYDVVATPTGGSGSSGPMQKMTVAAAAPAAAWLTGLQPGTLYGVSVRAVNVVESGPWGNASSPQLTPNEAPSPVALLTIDNITQSTAIARWVSTAKNLTVTLTKVGAIACGGVHDEAPVSLVRGVLSSPYSFTGLSPGVRYRVLVSAVNVVAISDPAITEFVTASSAPNSSVGTPTLNYIPSSNRLSVTWFPIPCETMYGAFLRYDVMITVNGNQTPLVTSQIPLIEVADLVPTANYSIQIRVVNDAGVGNWSKAVTTVSPYKILPSPVTYLSVNATYNNATVSWDVPASSNQGVTYSATLELLRAGSCGRLQQPVLVQTLYLGSIAVQLAGQSSSRIAVMQLSELQPWSEYRITVTAQNVVGATSNSSNFTTLSGSPPTATVSNVLVSNVTAFSALVSWQSLPCSAWTSPDVAYRYQLTDTSSVSGSPIATNTTKSTTVLLTSLSTYHGYSLVVQAVVGISFGPSSAAVYFTTLLAAPTRVQRIDVNMTSPTSVQLRWSSPTPHDAPVSTYELVYQRLATGGCPAASPSFSGAAITQILTTASLNLEKLQPWATYAVWLSASNPVGRSPNASATFNLTYDVPDAALNITGRALSDTKLAYSWSQPDCLSLRGPLLGYEYKLVLQSLSTVVKNGTINSLNVTLVELSAYTEYAFFVRVKNLAGGGPWSSLPSLKTLPADPPAPPFIDLLSAISPDELLVGFNNTDVANVIRYCLTYTATDKSGSTTADQTASCTLEGAANTSFIVVRLSNLMPYTNYRIQVRLGTVAGWGGSVLSAVIRTNSSLPSEPTSLSLAEFNESSLFFAWQDPLSPNGPILSYQLSYWRCPGSGASLNCSYSGVSLSSARAQLLSGLCPGTCYRVAVAAATDMGLGNVTTMQVFTAPGQPVTPPTPELLSVSSTTVTVKIYAVQPLYGPITSYLILVSRSIQKKRRSADSSDPSTLTASNSAGTVYADIPAGDVPTNGYVIVLGDNRTTAGGRYISLPLEPSTSYEVSQVAVSTLSNVTRMSSRVVLPVVTSPVPEAVLPWWVWIVVVVAIVAVIAVIVVVIICLRRKHRQKQEKANYETYNGSDNDLALYRDQLELINNQSWPDNGKDGETRSSVPNPVWHGFWNLIYKLESPRYVLTEQQPESADLLTYSGPSISFEQEFKLLPQGRKASCDVAQRQINAELNRVSHILPYDDSRVKLHYPLPATGTDYINASYIRGYGGNPAYIATACPFNDKTRSAFWCMIVQENVAHVVMVTNVVDGSIVKTSQFWPASQGSSDVYGDIAVLNAEVNTLAHFTVHRLRLDCGGGGDGYDGVCREVMLFHFTSWPEHGVPSDALPFLEFCHVVRGRTRHHRGKRSKGLTAVMCGTGVSTTGVFIAADVLMDQADLENVVSMHKVVRCLREDRMHMVRTLRQYYFLYDVLFEHFICHRMSRHVLELRQHYKTLTSQRMEGLSGFTREFAVLDQFTPRLTKEQCRDAILDANKTKNFSIDVLPPDAYRPVLKGAGGPGNDYINAVFVDGYVVKAHYIITQTPLANTIVDFWKLVYEQNVTAIVSLDEPRDISSPGNTFSDPFATWLPSAGVQLAEHSLDKPAAVDTMNAIAYGPFCVKCTAQETLLHLTVRKLNLHNKLCPNAPPRELLQLHLTTWPLGAQKAPKTGQALLTLESRLNRWMSHWDTHNSNGSGGQWLPADASHRFDSTQSPPRRVLAHCSDGVSRSGLFVAACTLCERIRVEPTINVFHAVKALRVRRPSAVIDVEQYRFLYRLAWDYGHTTEGVRGWSTARTATHESRPAATAVAHLQRENPEEMPDGLTDNCFENDLYNAIGDGPRQKWRLVP